MCLCCDYGWSVRGLLEDEVVAWGKRKRTRMWNVSGGVSEKGRVSKRGMLAGRVRRIISGPILPKCISVVAPEYARMCVCVCVSVAYTRPCDIVATRCDPEIESIQTQPVDTTKNHCAIRLEAPITNFEAYSLLWSISHLELYILTRMNNKIRETHVCF